MARAIRPSLICVLFILAAFSAVPVSAAPPTNDSTTTALALHLHSSGTITDIEEATLQTGEATASCATGGVDDDSVWFRINVPAGTLTIVTTTGEANFDTVISLYLLPRIGGAETLVELACAVDPGNAATLTTSVTGGQYLARVASDDGLPLGARTLNYDVSFSPPSLALVPVNDDITSARAVVLNKSSQVKKFEYGTASATDPTPSCAARKPSGTLWYTFTGVAGQTLVTAEGSTLGIDFDIYTSGPGIAVYHGTPGSLTFDDCDDSSGINGAGQLTFTAAPLSQYYVMVYYDFLFQDLTAASSVKLLVSPAFHSIISNGSFTDSLTGWTVKNGTGDGIASDSGTPNNDNAFRFVGGAGENSQLKQKLTLTSNLFIPENSLLAFSYKVRSDIVLTPPGTIRAEFKITYADGTVVKIKHPLPVPATLDVSNGFNFSFLIERKSPVKIQFALKSKAPSGDVAFDDLSVAIVPLNPARSSATSVMPLPIAPGR